MNRPTTNPTTGFTLIEVLVVLAVLAILLGLTSSSMLNSIRSNQVIEAARSFAGDLMLARSASQKSSQAASVSWSVNADLPILSYSLSRNGATVVKTVPDHIKITCVGATGGACVSAAKAITYVPSFGEASAGAVFKVSSANANIRPVFVKVGGVTGKVMFSESQD